MKNYFYSLVAILFLLSCNGQSQYGDPKVDVKEIQRSFKDWWNYYYKDIMLSKDFVAIDTQYNTITKEAFLQELIQGKTMPIELESNDGKIYYKLFAIQPDADTSISAVITESAFNEYAYYKMEGKPFPDFNFKDLNGNTVDNKFFKGKITIIKCWYIHCTTCVKEFPQVNGLVKKYQNRNDILFVSLAEDTPEQLQKFLSKKPLLYIVIPNMKQYMNEVLQLNAFPTHFILDKDGKIVKVLSNYESLEYALKNIIK